ncbi:MAG TPA: HRDC domain-containing protein [Rudaea sp.]|nr:HRDC domain-containing protein [Rudaea sp.]
MYDWISNEPDLAAWISAQPVASVIGLDTEFMRTDTFYARLALVQAGIGDRIGVIDAPALHEHAALAARLADPRTTCVMHSASEDLEALSTILPDGPANLFDTQIAAAMTGFGAGLSYQKLVAALIGVDLPKGETRSDWLKRPLTQSQLDYAAQDVEHLAQVHALLAQKLDALGRGEWLVEDSRRLVEKVCRAGPDPQPQRAYPRAFDWPREAQAMLRRVLLWREATARAIDKPRSWILDDARILDLAANPPRDGADLFERCKGLRALRGPQREELLGVLHAPLTAQDLDFTPIPPPLSGAQRRTVSGLRDAVAAIAQTLDIPDGLLCPRRHLETLVADGIWPSTLEGWRKPLLHDALMAYLPA